MGGGSKRRSGGYTLDERWRLTLEEPDVVVHEGVRSEEYDDMRYEDRKTE